MDDYRPKWMIDIIRGKQLGASFFIKNLTEIFTYKVVLYKEE
jgi:hypothetical protein